MGNFLQQIGQKLTDLFTPKPQVQPAAYTNNKQYSSPIGPGLNDPYIQNMANQNRLNQMQAQIQPDINQTNILLSYMARNPQAVAQAGGNPMYGPQQVTSSQPQNSEVGQPKQVAYQPPKTTTDPYQAMAMFSVLRNLMQNNQSQAPVMRSISTTPYTSAANQIGQSRQQFESAVLPSVYGNQNGGGSMLS